MARDLMREKRLLLESVLTVHSLPSSFSHHYCCWFHPSPECQLLQEGTMTFLGWVSLQLERPGNVSGFIQTACWDCLFNSGLCRGSSPHGHQRLKLTVVLHFQPWLLGLPRALTAPQTGEERSWTIHKGDLQQAGSENSILHFFSYTMGANSVA